uniref:Uncharacterized protein n=1 Tax=Anguilla anguilla TaxID=7936 RepID=A0A0E9XKB0_ANGAN
MLLHAYCCCSVAQIKMPVRQFYTASSLLYSRAAKMTCKTAVAFSYVSGLICPIFAGL